MKDVTIFTDGSSRGNPGRGGWGAVTIYQDAHKKFFVEELGGREELTTNNRMEMRAALEALKFFDGYYEASAMSSGDVSFLIYTDSAYLLNGVTKWMYGWSRNNWISSGKEEVKNRDIWEQFVDVVSNKKIAWKLIPGHSGIIGNERCDEISTGSADETDVNLYRGPLSGYPLQNILNVSTSPIGSSDTRRNKSSSNSKSSKKPYSYVSVVDGNVETHTTWADCEQRVKGQSGARFKKSFSKEDEENIISDFTQQ